MVFDASKTGLLPVISTKTRGSTKSAQLKLDFQKCVQPAPLTLKPYSDLLNPFNRGCSIFCNHPHAGTHPLHVKKTSRRNEGKEDYGVDEKALAERVGGALEEMLYRYRVNSEDESDESSEPHQRAVLVLDLRRNASSQELLTSNLDGRDASVQSMNLTPVSRSPDSSQAQTVIADQVDVASPTKLTQEVEEVTDGCAEDTEMQRRRGKLRKKKKKPGTDQGQEKSAKEVVGLVEPGETQISNWKEGDELSWPGSTPTTPQPSLEPLDPSEKSIIMSDIFDNPTLRHLRRCLTHQQAEGEFRRIWRKVLLEALAASAQTDVALPKHEEETIPPSDLDDWMAYPRVFKYSSARFDLPVNKQVLKGMSSLEYLRDYVVLDKEYRLLYYHVLQMFKEGEGPNWVIRGNKLIEALGVLMGRPLKESEVESLKKLVSWENDDLLDLRTWIGLCALTERVFGLAFSAGLEPNLGQRLVIEKVDFDGLNQRIHALDLKPELSALLQAIQV